MANPTPSEKGQVKVTDHFLLRLKIREEAFTLLSSFPLMGIGRLSVQLLITAKFERLWVAPIFNKYSLKINDQRFPTDL